MYHGNGYTQGDVERMPLDELQAHVDRLYQHLQEEQRAQKRALEAAKRRRR